MKVGDKVRRIKCDKSGFQIGDTATIVSLNGDRVYVNIDGKGNEVYSSLEYLEPIGKSPLTKQKMTTKKIIKVLAVDKKTGEVLKNTSVVAENEQTAILKAFGVDVEKVYIKTTEEGEFEEEKPVKVIMDKSKAETPKK